MGLLALFKPKTRTDLSTQVVQGGSAAVAPNVAQKFAIRSMVAAGMTIEGNITSDNGAAVDGVVRGDITVKGPNCALLIREGAVVHGNVRASLALVRGRVQGDIDARFVRLYPGSHVTGRIRSARLIVDDGAVIENDEVAIGGGEGVALPPPTDQHLAHEVVVTAIRAAQRS